MIENAYPTSRAPPSEFNKSHIQNMTINLFHNIYLTQYSSFECRAEFNVVDNFADSFIVVWIYVWTKAALNVEAHRQLKLKID